MGITQTNRQDTGKKSEKPFSKRGGKRGKRGEKKIKA